MNGPDPLDNPFWSALATRHWAVALRDGDVARYPPEFAPFLGVASADADAAAALAKLVAPGETVLLLGIAPAGLPSGWTLQALGDLAQMACDAPLEVVPGPEIIELGQRHRDDVLALTALVYPHYFRARTMDLGRYFGIYREGRLAAMIGERLGTGADIEMSAICTHPDFNGLGYARRLTAWLTNQTLAQGRLPFLHVSPDNTRARLLYERMGFRLRRHIPFWSLQAPVL
ncbi:GNAT family N-acetyltransferase [Luteimonas sp. 8-5]|uniref:GNAT family N-acetyltransferase n=1 Tax=Luteimonas sp. 8-5 TaxID=3039387 RepID=UPI002436997E|nr:GNAT family N-acetyltransferase [Luteimonas sp. 8-5]MDG6347767.1 GNAT family N-acetyltransferase [Luteimonas sp. 8-5]